jgi:hypothetical protein
VVQKRTTADGRELTPKQHAALITRQIEQLERERMKRGWYLDPPDDWAQNRYILSWWKPKYDEILGELILKYGHGWHQCLQELEKRLEAGRD